MLEARSEKMGENARVTNFFPFFVCILLLCRRPFLSLSSIFSNYCYSKFKLKNELLFYFIITYVLFTCPYDVFKCRVGIEIETTSSYSLETRDLKLIRRSRQTCSTTFGFDN